MEREKGEKKKGTGRQARKSEVIKQLIFSPVVCTHRCEMGGGPGVQGVKPDPCRAQILFMATGVVKK